MEYFELSYKKPKPKKIGGKFRRMSDEQLQSRINAVKHKLMVNNGYNEQSATDVLNYVADKFARGEECW